MRFGLYRMTPQGIIATANMVLCGAILLLYPRLLPPGTDVLYVILQMPTIFLVSVHTGGPDAADLVVRPVVIVANAYLWGHSFVWLYRKVMVHFGREKTAPNTASHPIAGKPGSG